MTLPVGMLVSENRSRERYSSVALRTPWPPTNIAACAPRFALGDVLMICPSATEILVTTAPWTVLLTANIAAIRQIHVTEAKKNPWLCFMLSLSCNNSFHQVLAYPRTLL